MGGVAELYLRHISTLFEERCDGRPKRQRPRRGCDGGVFVREPFAGPARSANQLADLASATTLTLKVAVTSGASFAVTW
jgi:hypothetical protein